MKLKEVGEFGIIARIQQIVGEKKGNIVLGIGDDAAALRSLAGRITLLTTDTLVEGVHFDLGFIDFRQLGWRALAANLSDIAAMGGEPLCATVCLCLPQDLSLKAVEELYEGIGELGRKYGVQIVGGDTSVSKAGVVISIALLGQVEENNLIARSGAQVGDFVCVTGDLGGSKAGLEILKSGRNESLTKYPKAIRKHRLPEPKVAEARFLAANFPIHAMIDISDGLSADLHHICEASGTGAQISEEKIPIDPETKEIAQSLGADPLSYALEGGEDFELLFTVNTEDWQKTTETDRDKIKNKVTVIGRIVSRERGISVIDSEGKERALEWGGYEHFRTK